MYAHIFELCMLQKGFWCVVFEFCVIVFFPGKGYFSKQMTTLGPDKMVQIDPSLHVQAAKHNYTP